MFWIYAGATVFGMAFVVPMVIGGLTSDIGSFDGGLDSGIDAEAGFDAGIDVETDMTLDAADTALGPSDTALGPSDTALGPSEIDGDLGALEDSGATTADAVIEAGADDGSIVTAASGSDFAGLFFSSLLSFRSLVFLSAFFGAAGLVFGLFYSDLVTLISALLVGGFAALGNSTLFGYVASTQTNSQIFDRTLAGQPATVVLPFGTSRRGRVRIDLAGQPQYLVARSLADEIAEFGVGDSVVVVKVENGVAFVTAAPDLG